MLAAEPAYRLEPGRSTRSLLAALLPASIVAAVSASLAPSYDEVYWLAAVRKLALGGQIYDTVIDNKGPLWYPIFTLSDSAPIPFWLARSLLLVLIAFALFIMTDTLLRRGPLSRGDRFLLSSLVVLMASAFSYFHLTPEFFATVPLLLAMLLARRPLLAAPAITAVLLIDPRTAVLIPGIIWYQTTGLASPAAADRARRWVMGGGAGLLGLLPYLVWPDLRFAVIEISTATRAGVIFSPSETLLVIAACVIPFASVIYLLGRPAGLGLTGPSLALAVGAVLIALVSIAPFPHYWTYLPLALTILSSSNKLPGRVQTWSLALVAAALLPIFTLAVSADRADRTLDNTYDRALSVLSSRLRSDHKVVLFTGDPHPAARFPDQSLGSSPVSFYLAMESSRRSLYHQEFRADLEQADAVWVVAPNGLTEASPLPRLAEEWDIVKQYLDAYPCRILIFPILVMERTQNPGMCGDS